MVALFRFTEQRLGLLWRGWMTRRIVGLHIDQRIFLHLEAAEKASPRSVLS